MKTDLFRKDRFIVIEVDDYNILLLGRNSSELPESIGHVTVYTLSELDERFDFGYVLVASWDLNLPSGRFQGSIFSVGFDKIEEQKKYFSMLKQFNMPQYVG